MTILDAYRESEDAALKAAEFLLPNATERLDCLTLFAKSIVQAHKNGNDPAVWAVTLSVNNFIRLNVGVIEVCALFPDVLHIVLDNRCLTDEERAELERNGGASGGWLPSYARVPGSEMWDLPTYNLPITIPLFQKAYRILIENAAESVKWRTGYYIHHSPGVLAYLRNTLQRPLPDPTYSITSVIDQKMQQLESAIDTLEQQALLKKIRELRREEKRLCRKGVKLSNQTT